MPPSRPVRRRGAGMVGLWPCWALCSPQGRFSGCWRWQGYKAAAMPASSAKTRAPTAGRRVARLPSRMTGPAIAGSGSKNRPSENHAGPLSHVLGRKPSGWIALCRCLWRSTGRQRRAPAPFSFLAPFGAVSIRAGCGATEWKSGTAGATSAKNHSKFSQKKRAAPSCSTCSS